MSKPDIIVSLIQHDEFYFLGKEYSKLNADYGKIWDDFISAGGYDINKLYGKYSYDCMVINHNINPDNHYYCPGVIVEKPVEVPDGFILMKFPAREYLLVTHEWVATKDDALGQIGRIDEAANNVVIPAGYIRHDGAGSQIEKIEVENMDTENGSRWENWVPIKNID